jgi:hypothetical protein
MRSPQFRDQASSKSIFRQGCLELVFVLQLFALLRGEIRLEKNFARIILLPHKNVRNPEEKEENEQSRKRSPRAMARRHDKPALGRFLLQRRQELVE